ncbi:MAG: hypothetical protein JXB33_05730 [Clostridia bacterium]|nr:hypothetical protein [Clostridia bacterium]
MTFQDIPGRQVLKERLAGEIREKHPGHAYIFEGPDGCGKKDFAVAFAHMILCMSESGSKPCGKCRHCVNIKAGGNGELYIIEESGKAISVSAIRELQDNIALLPVCNDKKAYVIVDGDNMTVQAQNCILKTLEEPPEYAHIIITASNSDNLIDTLKSRAVLLHVGINSIAEIKEYLYNATDRTEAEISLAAQCSSGSIGKAMEILESREFGEGRELAVDFITGILEKNFREAHGIADRAIKYGMDIFFAAVSGIMRDMIVFGTTGNVNLLINMDKKDIIINGASRYPGNVLARIAFISEQAAVNIGYNASKKQTMDAMIVKITEELTKW